MIPGISILDAPKRIIYAYPAGVKLPIVLCASPAPARPRIGRSGALRAPPPQQLRDVPLEAVVGRDPDGALHASPLQRLVDLRLGEGGAPSGPGPERHLLTLLLLPLDLGQQQFVPTLGAADVAGPQLDRQTIPLPGGTAAADDGAWIGNLRCTRPALALRKQESRWNLCAGRLKRRTRAGRVGPRSGWPVRSWSRAWRPRPIPGAPPAGAAPGNLAGKLP
jgi:hypothetical protein